MRHVTDGELHAFLDGALDLLPEGRGDEVRDHLADCPACRERLQDEESVRLRASEILGTPDLSQVGLPTFEELRERAEAPSPEAGAVEEVAARKTQYRGPLRGLPMAWAATIVLALGVGWMGGQVWQTIPMDGRPTGALDRLEVAPVQEGIIEDQEADLLTTLGSDSLQYEALVVTGRRQTDEEPAEELGRDPIRQATPDSVVREDVVVTASRQREAPAVAQPQVPEFEAVPGAATGEAERRAVLQPDSTGAQRPGDTTVAAERVDSATVAGFRSEALALEELVVTALPIADSIGARAASPRAVSDFMMAAGAEAVPTSSRVSDSVKALLGVPGLAVPVLEVASVEWEERVPGERALVIRQLLSPGDTLELHYLGLLMGTDMQLRYARAEDPVDEMPGRRAYANVLEASLPKGWNQVVMERERGLLVARGPTDEDQLKALLKMIR